MRKWYFFLVVIAVLFSCKGRKDTKVSQDYLIEGDTVYIPSQSSLQKKIKTDVVRYQPYNESFTASGIVQAIPNQYAQIVSPFAGRVTKTFVHLGQKIRTGSPLFEISSAAFFDAVKNYCQAQQEMNVAYINMRREQDLVKNKVGAKKEEEDAELNYSLKKSEMKNAKSALSVYHINIKRIYLGKPLIIRSPIAGDIVKNDIVIGQYIKEDAEPLATIANLDRVWVIAHIKEKDISLINSISRVGVVLIAFPNREISGKIYHIGQMMDMDTHSVEVIIECNNKNRLMKPGMYGYVKLHDRATQKIIIPSSALLQEDNSTYVFVKIGKGKYVKRDVQTISATANNIAIISGLKPHEEIIIKGAFYLNNIF